MQAEIAWAAGLFEGEGSIHIPNRSGTYFQLSLTSTDEDVLRRFCEIVKIGRMRPIKGYHSTNKKPLFQWNAGGIDAAWLLEEFMPWLGNRRCEKAQEALARYDMDAA